MEMERNHQKKNIIKSIRNLFILKKKNEAIEDRKIRDIKTLFEQQEENDYYKRIREDIFWNNNYSEYESSGDRNKNLSVKELNHIKLSHT